ncbi:hypothetical protein D3C73_174110 [compost metagenome]|jgi:hypothetical protein
MSHLYHGSGYKQPELKPGIMHSGELQRWDKTESNEFLYATTLMEEAIAQGLASVIEKHWNLSRYQSSGDTITIIVDGPLPSLKELQALTVYLYKIHWEKSVWVLVDNLHNGMSNEYKTKQVIGGKMIESCEPVDLSNWLKHKKIEIKGKTAAMRW